MILSVTTKRRSPLVLAAVARALCQVAPVIQALRGKPLMLHGSVSVTKRLDMTPKEAMRQLKAMKPITIDAVLSETPAEPESAEQKPSKESLKSAGG